MYNIKESIFKCILFFFFKSFAKIMAQRDVHFVSSQAIELLRIVPSLGQDLSLLENGAVGHVLKVNAIKSNSV